MYSLVIPQLALSLRGSEYCRPLNCWHIFSRLRKKKNDFQFKNFFLTFAQSGRLLDDCWQRFLGIGCEVVNWINRLSHLQAPFRFNKFVRNEKRLADARLWARPSAIEMTNISKGDRSVKRFQNDSVRRFQFEDFSQKSQVRSIQKFSEREISEISEILEQNCYHLFGPKSVVWMAFCSRLC